MTAEYIISGIIILIIALIIFNSVKNSTNKNSTNKNSTNNYADDHRSYNHNLRNSFTTGNDGSNNGTAVGSVDGSCGNCINCGNGSFEKCINRSVPAPKAGTCRLPPYINTMESSEISDGIPNYSTDQENAQTVVDSLNFNTHPRPFITYYTDNPKDAIVVEFVKHPNSIQGAAIQKTVQNVEKTADANRMNVKFIYKTAQNDDPISNVLYKYHGIFKYQYFGHYDENAIYEWIFSVVN